MPLLLLLVAILLILVVGMWLTFGLIHLALTLLVAGFVGWIADLIVPGKLPYGWLGAILAGLLGSWLGQLVIGQVGPPIFGIRIIPALLGAIILAFLVSLVSKTTVSRRGS